MVEKARLPSWEKREILENQREKKAGNFASFFREKKRKVESINICLHICICNLYIYIYIYILSYSLAEEGVVSEKESKS